MSNEEVNVTDEKTNSTNVQDEGSSPTLPATGFSEQKIAEFKEAFDYVDDDQDGIIKTSEVLRTMRCLGLNPTDAEMIDLLGEVENDGTINFGQFKTILSLKLENRDREEEVLEAFKTFDLDGNGLISPSELKTVLINLGEKMTDEEIDEMIREADVDHDGQINYEEFVTLMTQTR